MLLRNLESDFVGGAYVFPGGGVDPDDGPPEIESAARSHRRRRVASAELRGGLAFWVARDPRAFEEAGLLLASTPTGPSTSTTRRAFVEHRRAVDSGERSIRRGLRARKA